MNACNSQQQLSASFLKPLWLLRILFVVYVYTITLSSPLPSFQLPKRSPHQLSSHSPLHYGRSGHQQTQTGHPQGPDTGHQESECPHQLQALICSPTCTCTTSIALSTISMDCPGISYAPYLTTS